MAKISEIDFNNTEYLNKAYLRVGCNLKGGGGEVFEVYIPNLNSIFDFSYDIENEKPIETILGKQKNTASLLLESLNQANAIFDALDENSIDENSNEVLKSTWSNLPGFKGVKTLNFTNQIDIEYYFGQFGEFDSEKEVFDKGIELIKLFAPSLGTDGVIEQSLLPLSGELMTKAALGLYKASTPEAEDTSTASTSSDKEEESIEASSGGFDAVKEGNLLNKAFTMVAETVNTFNKVVDGTANVPSPYNDKSQLFCQIMYGALKTPVFVPKSFSIAFNATEMVRKKLDGKEIDYPLKATVSLKSCQSLELTHKGLIEGIRSTEKANKDSRVEV